jgi:hypothetical protein
MRSDFGQYFVWGLGEFKMIVEFDFEILEWKQMDRNYLNPINDDKGTPVILS